MAYALSGSPKSINTSTICSVAWTKSLECSTSTILKALPTPIPFVTYLLYAFIALHLQSQHSLPNFPLSLTWVYGPPCLHSLPPMQTLHPCHVSNYNKLIRLLVSLILHCPQDKALGWHPQACVVWPSHPHLHYSSHSPTSGPLYLLPSPAETHFPQSFLYLIHSVTQRMQ